MRVIENNTDEIKSYGIKTMGVFGSFARSDNTRKSDVDILIEFQKDRKAFDNYMDLKTYLEKLLRRKVDLVIKEALKPSLKSYVLKEVVYAKL